MGGSCNYEARAEGIRAAMPISKAFELEPTLFYIKGDDAYYEAVSARIMKLLAGFGLPVETQSIDEAALDADKMDYDAAMRLAARVKEEIEKETGLRCTVGVCTGKLLAKMVCDAAKPNALKGVPESEIKAFISQMHVDRLPGVGSKTSERLRAMGIETIGEIAKSNPMLLIGWLGSAGKELYLLANGIDNSRVVESQPRLSIGRERTLATSGADAKSILHELNDIALEVSREVRERGLWFRGVVLKVRYADFTERLKSVTLANYTDSEDKLGAVAMRMAAGLLGPKGVRKIGIRVFRLIDARHQRKLV